MTPDEAATLLMLVNTQRLADGIPLVPAPTGDEWARAIRVYDHLKD